MGMAKLKFLSEIEVQEVAEQFLKVGLAPYGYGSSQIEEVADFDGDFIFRLEAQVEKRVPADLLIELMGKIHSQLRMKGENRFVILSTKAKDTEVIVDEEEE
jgi:hypothetical protein